MKVLQVIDTLDVGGAEKVFVTMCNMLSEKNQDVAALFLLNAGVLKDTLYADIPIIELQRGYKWDISKMLECSHIIKEYDVIHCHFRHVYRYISLVKKLFLLKTNIILQDHYGSIDVDKKVPFLFNSLLKPKYYIGVSQTLCHWANNNLYVTSKNIFVLENIIIKQDEKEILNKRFDLILVSNFKKVKNNLFAIKLAKKANKSLLLVGKNQDENYYSELTAAIDDNPIIINSDISEAQPILHTAKLGLHTSISETGPLVLIEYLAQKLPFLAYKTGEVANILEPYFPQYFMDNFNEQEWVDRIGILLKTQPDTDKMDEVFERHFAKEQYYTKLNTIYQCVITS